MCADADVLLHKGNVLQDGVDVVRRFSGGGTVPSHRLLPDVLNVLVAPA
jgi:lipoate-protein ligase A